MSQRTRQSYDSLLLGVDLGGTKIAAIALSQSAEVHSELRISSPSNDYQATLWAIRDLTNQIALNAGLSQTHPVGIGTPGSINPETGLLQNANSTWLNDRPLLHDLETSLQRPVRIANDANCFALSEAHDGAGAGAQSVFGVILGTGSGGGMVVDKRLINGPRGIGGEWGHNPLPWANDDEIPGPQCWCGHRGCMETWVSGPGLEADYYRQTNNQLSGPEIETASNIDERAKTALERHANRLARGLASVVNLFDPEVVVLGGGLSQMAHLYRDVPTQMAPYIFSRSKSVDLRPPVYGDASGVRGAARLWWDQQK